MPAIDFPASPAVNDEYSFEGRTWRWNGTGWEVKEYPAALALGSAANPSLYFTGDPNTGLYSPGADQVAISTGGTGRLFVDASGSVGVGGSPATNLDVFSAGTTVVRSYASAGNQAYLSAAGNAGAPGTSAFDIIQDGTSIAYIYQRANQPLLVGTNNTERLRITSAGLVGIGTSSPNHNLQIGPGTGTTGYSFSLTTPAVNSGSNSSFAISGTYSSLVSTINLDANGVSSNGGYRGDLAFRTTSETSGPVERMRITGAGLVGIGTSSPSYPLHLNTAAASDIETATQNSAGLARYGTRGSGNAFAGSFTAGKDFELWSANGERARIDSSGRLLVGTSTSRDTAIGDARLQIEGTTYGGSSMQMICNSAADAVTCAHLAFGRSKTTAIGGTGQVVNGDRLGAITWNGAQNSTLSSIAGLIECIVDGEVQTSGDTTDMPGRLVFSTTSDGASSPTERLRIQENGDLRMANATTFYPATDNAVAIGANVLRFSVVYAVNGTIQTSDKREKTAVANSSLGSSFIKSLRPVSYKWVEGGKRPTGEFDEDNNYIYESVPGSRTHWGFIAQEVKEAVDSAGVDFGGWVLTDKDDPDSQQALRYDQFIAPLTKALQETMAELEALKAEVAALKAQ